MKNHFLYLAQGIVILTMVLLPQSSFAALTVSLPEASTVRIPSASERDPYLTQAIDSLPNYTHQQTGTAVAVASPITTEGNWPRPALAVARKVATARPAVPLVPTGSALVVLEGEASYYSRAGCLGCDPAMIMANGQSLDDTALTMAIGANLKHLVGRPAKVTSLATGKSVTVRITDTGGFYQAKYGYRVADLTVATKNAIGMAGGVGQVRVEVF